MGIFTACGPKETADQKKTAEQGEQTSGTSQNPTVSVATAQIRPLQTTLTLSSELIPFQVVRLAQENLFRLSVPEADVRYIKIGNEVQVRVPDMMATRKLGTRNYGSGSTASRN